MMKQHHCLVADSSCPAVGDDGFETVTHFDPKLPVLDRSEDQDAVVFAGRTDAPSLEQSVREVIDLAAVQ